MCCVGQEEGLEGESDTLEDPVITREHPGLWVAGGVEEHAVGGLL